VNVNSCLSINQTWFRSLAENTLGVYFDAYRTKAYDGGGEENLTFNGTYCNVGGGKSICRRRHLNSYMTNSFPGRGVI
jgi:hypothetical protein